MENKNLTLARQAKQTKDTESAKKYYELVREEDPSNGEANFFYLYYAIYEGKNGEICTRTLRLHNGLENSFKQIAASNDSVDEKIAVLSDVLDFFIPLTWELNRYMNSLFVGTGSNRTRVLSNADINAVSSKGIESLYKAGDWILQYFGDTNATSKLAVACWKEAIILNRKWYAYKLAQTPEAYSEKIKKYEPDYVMPEKAGCIQFGDKR